jgi:hypothetical protein
MTSKLAAFKSKQPKSTVIPAVELPGGRWAILIPLLISSLLLLDYTMETTFAAAKIISMDTASSQINTEKGSFLAEFPGSLSPHMVEGDVIILELSRITNTVVAYKPQDSIYVFEPRESVFDYWYIAAISGMISLFLLIRWEKTNYRFELLMLNLIMLTILGVTYLISH